MIVNLADYADVAVPFAFATILLAFPGAFIAKGATAEKIASKTRTIRAIGVVMAVAGCVLLLRRVLTG